MSDHAEKKKDEKTDGDAHGGDAKKKGGIGALLTKLPVLLGGAMTVEAVVMLIAFKLLAGGPKSADAGVDLAADKTKTEEKADDAHGKPAEDEHGAAAKKDDGHGAPEKKADEHADPHAAKEDAHGGGGHGDEKPAAAAIDPKKIVELPVVEFRAPNKVGGKTFLYDVSIYAVTRQKNKADLETAIKERGALIKDRIRTIIAQSDPDKLGGGAEPGLETLRRQVRYALEQIVGEGIVDEVLVPRCIPFRTDF